MQCFFAELLPTELVLTIWDLYLASDSLEVFVLAGCSVVSHFGCLASRRQSERGQHRFAYLQRFPHFPSCFAADASRSVVASAQSGDPALHFCQRAARDSIPGKFQLILLLCLLWREAMLPCGESNFPIAPFHLFSLPQARLQRFSAQQCKEVYERVHAQLIQRRSAPRKNYTRSPQKPA